IFFTLSSGLVFIHFHRKNPLVSLLPFLPALVLNLDYGIYGILLIGCMYLLRRDTELGIISIFVLNLSFLPLSSSQFLSLLALPIILAHERGYPGMVGKSTGKAVYPKWKKYFFYVFYPLHLTILYAAKVVPIPFVHSSRSIRFWSSRFMTTCQPSLRRSIPVLGNENGQTVHSGRSLQCLPEQWIPGLPVAMIASKCLGPSSSIDRRRARLTGCDTRELSMNESSG
ncbi:MAG: hypothetical protein JSW61_02265, partial [Candidatus Thorarchaeota archaeon]